MSTTPQPLRIDVAQLGARMHYAVPAGFAKAGALNRFYTDIWYPEIQNFLPPGFDLVNGLSRLRGRFHPDIPTEKITSCPMRGLRYAAQLQFSKTEQQRIRHFVKMGRWFSQWVAGKSSTETDCCYGYNSASLEWFASSNAQKSFKVLEQTLVPRAEQKNLLREEFSHHGIPWPDDKWNQEYEQREQQEWKLADLIVCGSDFVKTSLTNLGVNPDKIRVVPYGTPAADRATATHSKSEASESFKLLFVGHGGIRKGLPGLFEALKTITPKKIELIIAGDVSDLPHQPEQSGLHKITYLNKVERDKIQDLMQQADAFVFPSLCEGSATVIYEAMHAGLPVICTPNSGSVITDQQDGLIVPAHDSERLSEAISRLIEDDDLRTRLRNAARETASHYTSDSFARRLLEVISESV